MLIKIGLSELLCNCIRVLRGLSPQCASLSSGFVTVLEVAQRLVDSGGEIAYNY